MDKTIFASEVCLKLAGQTLNTAQPFVREMQDIAYKDWVQMHGQAHTLRQLGPSIPDLDDEDQDDEQFDVDVPRTEPSHGLFPKIKGITANQEIT